MLKKILFCLAVISVMCVRPAAAENAPNVHVFTVRTIDGEEKNLADYQGKALLIVNTASKCGFTPQLGGLEKLYQQYKDKGLEVLAFPANNFKNQEPGDNAQIKGFCLLNYKTTFPLFSKISVAGDDIAPLYQYLITLPGLEGPITWNFNKFLVDQDGNVVARFGTRTDPLAPEITGKIDELLAK
ncbi:MAG: glutathione peroxidase [Candidatus Omnitrophota bacterium]|nr:glutathione peroxidase [Candidatus Omnitrophota bacterium]MDZ4242232.1 glutathione peroxidase [Candidatus Omnitrophota bacterium]